MVVVAHRAEWYGQGFLRSQWFDRLRSSHEVVSLGWSLLGAIIPPQKKISSRGLSMISC